MVDRFPDRDDRRGAAHDNRAVKTAGVVGAGRVYPLGAELYSNVHIASPPQGDHYLFLWTLGRLWWFGRLPCAVFLRLPKFQ